MIWASSPAGLDAQHLHCHLGGGVNFGGAAHEAHGHRHLNGAHQIAVGVLLPGCEGGVLSAAGGVGVGTGLDSAGVVAGGNDHGDDAVHDALVVGGRPVGIAAAKA